MIEIENAEQTAAFNVFELNTAAKAKRLKKFLLSQKGVIAAGVNLSAEKVYVRFKSEETRIENIIYSAKKFGFLLELQNEKSASFRRRYETEYDTIKSDLLFCLILSFPLFLSMFFVWVGIDFPLLTNIFHNPKIQLIFATPVILLIVSRHIFAVFKSPFSIVSFAFLGSFNAYILSVYYGFFEKNAQLLYFDTSVIILLAVHFAKFFEVQAKRKTARKMGEFMNPTAAQIAKVIRDDGSEELIDASAVKNDDILLVESNEQIAADGIIVSGNAKIDESFFSGDNIPVEKKVGDKVYAHTANLANSFTIMVSNIGERTEFSKILRMMQTFQIEKTPVRKFSEKLLIILFFAVLAAVLANALAGIYFEKTIVQILTISASIFAVSCPCTFYLASSGVTAVGTQIGMKYGIFFKFGKAFDTLSKVKTLVLVKPKTFSETLPKAVEELQKLGISIFMITHESRISAKKIEKLTGIPAKNLATELDFAGKADFVKKLTQSSGAVAALGNGLNDAPALSQADLGICVIGGNNILLDVSEIVLKNYDFLNLCYAVKIAKKAVWIKKQNLFFAFFFNVIGILLVIMNVFNPAAIASLAMAISCACVAINSLRMKRIKNLQ
jgi:cation transport ATPase